MNYNLDDNIKLIMQTNKKSRTVTYYMRCIVHEGTTIRIHQKIFRSRSIIRNLVYIIHFI